jgi:hypothetical protein
MLAALTVFAVWISSINTNHQLLIASNIISTAYAQRESTPSEVSTPFLEWYKKQKYNLQENNSLSVKIMSPVKGEQVPSGQGIIVSGISTDNATSDCKVSVIVNDVKPYQQAVANGTGGTNDYSSWNFMITPAYTTIKEGPDNKITSKLECTPNLTKWYSVNVTGIIPSTITTSSSTPLLSSDTIASISQLEEKKDRTNLTTIRNSSTSPTLILSNASMLNITSPATDHEIPSGSKFALFGTSMDDFYKDCKVYAKKNDLPYQKVTAAGLTGSGDYSVWKFSYDDIDNEEYSKVTPGNTNNITAMISCSNIDQKASPPESKVFTNNKTTDAATVTNTTAAYATLNLIGINQPPLAIAHTEKKEVKEGEEVTLDGEKSSDPNGDPLTYLWKQKGESINDIDIINSDDAVAQFKIPDDLVEDTTLSFELTVEDGYGETSTDVINIAAIANTKPVANAGDDIQAIRGEEVILDGTDSYDPDPTGKVTSYLWAANNDGDNEDGSGSSRYLQGSNQPVARFSVPLVQEDTTFEFTLTVIDDEGAEDKDKIEVKVEAPASEPQQLSPVEQQQSLSADEQHKKQVQHEKEAEDEEEDENNGIADIRPMPPSSDVIQIPDIIDLFS